MFRGLFKNAAVGKPEQPQKDWDETIHAEVDEPDLRAPTTGGRVLTKMEAVDLYGLPGVRKHNPSSLTFWDMIPAYAISILILLVAVGCGVALWGFVFK